MLVAVLPIDDKVPVSLKVYKIEGLALLVAYNCPLSAAKADNIVRSVLAVIWLYTRVCRLNVPNCELSPAT